MKSEKLIFAIDCGTTSCRTLAFSHSGSIVDLAQEAITQHYPASGWVEHDANEIWEKTLSTLRDVADNVNREIAAIGITNQRETVVIWDRDTGEPIYKAIVWQDRRTADFCRSQKLQGHEQTIRTKTGFIAGPIFFSIKNCVDSGQCGRRAGAC